MTDRETPSTANIGLGASRRPWIGWENPRCRQSPGARAGPSTGVRLTVVCAASRPNGQHVDDTLCVHTIEDHAPVAYTQPPKSLRAAQQLDVPFRQRPNRGADSLSIPAAEPA